MSANTSIEWATHTFNPWWGCTEDGDECDHCYARAFAKRVGYSGRALPVAGQGPLRAPKPVLWGHDAERRFFGDKHWREPLEWNAEAEKSGEQHRVFCASMSDVGERMSGPVGEQMDRERRRLVKLIEATPALTWLLLTKRPQNMPGLFPEWAEGGFPDHIWVGTTAGNQVGLDKRAKWLLRINARLHFLSVEPMLGPIDLGLNIGLPLADGTRWFGTLPGIKWVIVGGESGAGARPFNLAWARSIVEQCREAKVPVFVKQLGTKPMQYSLGDMERVTLKDAKGGDWSEWEEGLRVREFPASTVATVRTISRAERDPASTAAQRLEVCDYTTAR